MVVNAIDWGDVPTWLGALTTLGALIAAGIVVRIEMQREDRTEQDRRRSRVDAERAEQAQHVAVWRHLEGRHPRILVRNGSTLPIFSVSIVLHHYPAGRVRHVFDLPNQGFFPPGDTLVEYPSDVVRYDDDGNLVDDGGVWVFELTFSDAAHRRWTRQMTGELDRVDEGS